MLYIVIKYNLLFIIIIYYNLHMLYMLYKFAKDPTDSFKDLKYMFEITSV